MTPIFARNGLRESWEAYRARLSGPYQAHLSTAGSYRNVVASLREHWRQEGYRLLAWDGPGHPCPTSNGITPIEEDDQGEARSAAS